MSGSTETRVSSFSSATLGVQRVALSISELVFLGLAVQAVRPSWP